MDPITLWLIVGAVLVVAPVGVGALTVNRRSALRRATEQRQLRGEGGAASTDAEYADELSRTTTDRQQRLSGLTVTSRT